MGNQPNHTEFQQAWETHRNNNLPRLVHHRAHQMLSQLLYHPFKIHLLTLGPKVKSGQGIKKSKSLPADKLDVICWRCKQPGHLKRDCPMPPFCVKCRQEGHLPYNCPQQNNRNTSSSTQAPTTADHQFSNIRNKCIHCGGGHEPAACPTKTWLHMASNNSKWTSQPGIVGTGKNNTNVFPPSVYNE